MQSNKPVIAVVGATGAQGGSLVRAILDDNQFTARAITRDPQSPAAQTFAARGAEVVAADLDDEQSLVAAFTGADAVFAVTFFWAHMDPDKELAHAWNLANAAKAARVPHVVWSTLEDTRRWISPRDESIPTLAGVYKVPHFDAKGAADCYFAELGVPTTYLRTSFYWDNLIHFGMGPKRGPDGTLAFTLPMGDAKLPGIAAEDIGHCALAIFRRGAETIGQSFGVAGEHLSGAEMAAALSSVLKEPVRHDAMSPEAYRALGFPGAEDLGNMFEFKRRFEREYRAGRDVTAARALYPRLLTFSAWLDRNAARIAV